jgi:hypothetical protein
MPEKRNAFAKHRGTIAVAQNEDGVFVLIDGVKIAKRNHAGWVPLRQGYTVDDVQDGTDIEVKLNGLKVHQR